MKWPILPVEYTRCLIIEEIQIELPPLPRMNTSHRFYLNLFVRRFKNKKVVYFPGFLIAGRSQ